MQTTLLGFAIAIILALVAALVGPLFIDWGQYRGEFEARASRLTGLDFRVTGAIDARLLPTPTLVLQGIEFGRPDEKVRARALRIEFGLGALVRGEWRITDARLEGPDFTAGLDGNGRLIWPAPKLDFAPASVSIERLAIEDGRAVLADAASGSRLLLEHLEFKGDLRSLAGPLKGEGSFVVGGHHYPYRVSTSHVAEDNGLKIRLRVDPIDRPLNVDADISIWIEHGTPRFDGSVQLARPVGRAPAGALIVEPWRVSSRLKGNGNAAVLEQIEFQYGPDERAIKVKGNANLTFGGRPAIVGVLSSPQIDLDRALALPDEMRRRPLIAMRKLAESFTGGLRLPIPTTLSIGVEAVTLGGATLARVGADLSADADGLDIKGLEFRAPGASQIRLSGRLGVLPTGVQFDGSIRADANDPRALVAWLAERSDAPAASAGPLRLAGDVTLGGEAIAIDRLKLELDRMTAAGRFAYTWASNNRPARLDAALTAPEIDLDRVHALAKAIFADAALDWPREGALSLKIGRALLADVEAKQADVDMRIDAGGLEIERLAVADFGGAALAVRGRIDGKGPAPRGTLSLELDARALDGVLALMQTLAPQAADRLRRAAGRLVPITLRAGLAVDPGAPGSTAARFKVDGRAGAFRIALQGDAGAANDAFNVDNLAALGAAKLNLNGRVDADDGGALAELIGLDRYVVVDKGPGWLALTTKGSLDGDLALEGRLVAGALEISTNGSIRPPSRADANVGLGAGLNLTVNNANVLSPRPVPAGRPRELIPTSVSAGLDLSEGTLSLSLAGTVAGTSVNGQLAIGIDQQPITVDGDVQLGSLDLPAVLAVALGIPAQSTAPNTNTGAVGLWPSEPFGKAPPPIRGQVAFKATRIAVTPRLAASDIRGVVRFGEPHLSLQLIDGHIADGRIAGELIFLPPIKGEGLIVRGGVRLAGVNADELLPGDGSISGRLTLAMSVEGTGMSAVALVGSLDGRGSFVLENGRLARLDPAAFDAVIRAVDRGLPIDAARVKHTVEAALAGGKLAVAVAEGTIAINAGQARPSNTVVRAQGADLAVGGSANLVEGAVDLRLTLSGMAGGSASTRPEIVIAVKGPINSPTRTTDVAALASWLALRAVEQQSKKLDVLEGRLSQPSAPAPDVPARSIPSAPTADPAQPKHTGPDVSQPHPTQRAPSTASPPPKPKAAPSTERVQPLPPPTDIRPAPATRTPRPPAAAAPARSWSEILFGR